MLWLHARTCVRSASNRCSAVGPVSQSVSYFTFPPRAVTPVPSTGSHVAVRLRHSRSNTSTEYSLPGATQLSQVRSISPSGLVLQLQHEQACVLRRQSRGP